MISIEFDDDEIVNALQKLKAAIGDLSPALKVIGEDLVESTKQRFVTTTSPEGDKWELNSVLSTLLYKEGDRPLSGETGLLMDQISKAISGDELEIYSSMKYAAMQQFGGTKSEFPFLWGDIPARPFLGISTEDESNILATIEEILINSIR